MHLFTHLKDFVRYDDSELQGFRFPQERGILHSTSPMEAEILSIQENLLLQKEMCHIKQQNNGLQGKSERFSSLSLKILSLHKPPQRILSMKNEDFGP